MLNWAESGHEIISQRPGTGADQERGRPRPQQRASVAAMVIVSKDLIGETGRHDSARLGTIPNDLAGLAGWHS